MGVVIPQVITEDKADAAQLIDGSLRFDSSKSHYLTRTPSSAGNRKTWTWSGWAKRSSLGASHHFMRINTGLETAIRFRAEDNSLMFYTFDGSSNTTDLRTTATYRDASAWYHIVFSVDTTQSTASNRVKIYVNGVQQTSFSVSTYPTQNLNTGFNQAALHAFGAAPNPTEYFNGALSNVYFIDGQALDPSYFGYTDQLTNTWRPKKLNLSSITTGKVYIDNTYTGGSVGSGIYNAALTNNITSGSYSGDTFTASNAAWVITFDLYNYDSFTLSSLSVGAQSNQTWYYSNDSSFASGVVGPNSGTIANGTWSTTISGTKYRYLRIQNVPSATFTVVGNITNTQNAWGINGFYLPFEGNSSIGQDQSGRGNNWTPVNFGGSNTLEKATGALPILNTDGGGKVARVGVRTDSNASSLVLALPLVGNANDVSATIKGSGSNKAITAAGNAAASSAQSNFYGGSFYFDGTGDYLTFSPGFTTGTGDFTVECWVYPISSNQKMEIWQNSSLIGGFYLSSNFNAADAGPILNRTSPPGSGWSTLLVGNTTLIASTWNHIAWVRQSGTIKMYLNGVQESNTLSSSIDSSTMGSIGAWSDGQYDLNAYIQDLRVYQAAKYTQNFIPASTDPDILPDTPSGVAYSSNVALVPSTDGAVAFDNDGDYLSLSQSDDFSFGTGAFTCEMFCYFNSLASDDCILEFRGNGSGSQGWVLFVNGSAMQIYDNGLLTASTTTLTTKRWYHLAISRTSGGTLYYFVDGIAAGTASWTTSTANTNGLRIGTRNDTTNSLDGFISNVHVVKGTALYTSNFTPPTAPITSVANTKLLCCKSNSSATAFDVSPGSITANGNAVATNFNPFTANINAVRGQESGYCTLNPIGLGGGTISDGNLRSTTTSATPDVGNFVMSSGKWYWEVTLTTSSNPRVGVYNIAAANPADLGGTANGWCLLNSPSRTYNSGSAPAYGDFAGNVGDVVMVAYNADTGRIWYGVNGRFFASGDPAAGNNPSQSSVTGNGIVPAVASGTGSNVFDCNFGQKPFKFPPPTGFQPLALANLPRPTIVRPDQYVGIVTYTGNATSRSINVGFKPDLVWLKRRGTTSESHVLANTVVGANAFLSSDLTNAENTAANCVTGFTNNGFTVGTQGIVNDNTMPFVAWCWKAGGNSNTYNINDVGYATASAAGLTAGTITPTGASVNTKSGFSIITYTGNGTSGTLSHGLGNSPGMVIIKSRSDGTTNWIVWHKGLTSGYYILLSSTGTQTNTSASQYFGNTSTTVNPSSTVITLGGANAVNNSSPATYVAYSWAEIPGFSRFGSYTGNGSTNGPVIITGFRPRWIMVKRTDVSNDWGIFDSTRDSFNLTYRSLYPNSAATENSAWNSSENTLDILSNGFKWRSTNLATNADGGSYIYAAFAETPSFNLYGGQANAR